MLGRFIEGWWHDHLSGPAEAKALLDAALEKLPYIPRISASRELQMTVENLAHQRGEREVTPLLVEDALAQSRSS